MVSSNVPTFISDPGYLQIVSFVFVSLAKALSVLFSKNQLLDLLLLLFSILYFIYLHLNLYYFPPSVSFGLSLLFFF